MSLKAMMISCCIDDRENRYGAVTDIPGAFLNADMKDTVHMILDGKTAKHMAKLEPTIYRKYTRHDKK